MTKANSVVKTQITASEDGAHTYEVQKIFEGMEGKTAIVIELYPTLKYSDINRLDLSAMHLLNHAGETGWNRVRIVNLFSTVFERKPLARQLQFDTENLEYFEKMLGAEDCKDCDIVVAWGTTLDNHKAAREMKSAFLQLLEQKGLAEQVKQFAVKTLETNEQISPHPLFLGLRHAREVWSVEKFPLRKVLQELEPKVPQKTGKKEGQKAEEKTSEEAGKDTHSTAPDTQKQKKETGKKPLEKKA